MATNLTASLRRLAAGLFGHARTRLQLLQIEIGEESERVGGILWHGLLLVMAIFLTIQMIAVLILASWWDTPYRLHAVVALVLIAAAGTVLAGWRFSAKRARTSTLFAAAAVELEKDHRALEPDT